MNYLPLAALTLAAAACAPVAAPADTPAAGTCGAAPIQNLVGQRYTEALGTNAQARSGARGVRVIRPGQAVTMDYRVDRLNIELNAGENVVSLRCG